MNNFGILYRFELKKLLKNKLTLFTLVITALIVLLTSLFPMQNKEIREAQQSINGRAIDDDLLGEMYEVIDDYGTVWNGTNWAYENLASF